VGQVADLPGAACLELVDGVIHLDPKTALLEAMLAGWVRQQRTRFLNEDGTIQPRVSLVRRLVDFTNAYPWQWRPADAEAFIEHLRSTNRERPIAMSTGRGYETTLALFMDFLTDRRYGWSAECLERFGQVPQQVFHEDNRAAHVVDYEGRPGRRPHAVGPQTQLGFPGRCWWRPNETTATPPALLRQVLATTTG